MKKQKCKKYGLYCPRCASEFHCPCGACKGKGWKWLKDDSIQCLNCKMRQSCDWWFQLDVDCNLE